jgi:hypothetical protein
MEEPLDVDVKNKENVHDSEGPSAKETMMNTTSPKEIEPTNVSGIRKISVDREKVS